MLFSENKQAYYLYLKYTPIEPVKQPRLYISSKTVPGHNLA